MAPPASARPRRHPSEPASAPLPANWTECVRGNRIHWENRRVRSELVCFGEVMYQPGGHCGPRQQRDFQLVFLHSGELRASVDGKPLAISPGQVGLFLPGKLEVFTFSRTRETHHSWCSVAPSMVSKKLGRQLAGAPSHLACDDVQSRLLAAGMALGRADSDIAQGVVDQIGVALLGAYVQASVEQAHQGAVALATRFLEEHLTDPDCLQRAHVAAGVSRNTLISRFRTELGVTPSRYLWRSRTERGIALLAEGQSVAEAAYACGFSDPFHFSRLVKALQGVAPSKLRAKPKTGPS